MRHFTPDEVDRLIPTLEFIFGQVYGQMASLLDLRRRLEAAGLPAVPEDLSALEPPPELASEVASYLGLLQRVAVQLRQVGELGGLVKDLEVGLVDFPATWDGNPVYLCWRYGEKLVSHYHDRTSGYSGRRPLGPGRVAIGTVRSN